MSLNEIAIVKFKDGSWTYIEVIRDDIGKVTEYKPVEFIDFPEITLNENDFLKEHTDEN